MAGEIQQTYINAVRYAWQNVNFKGETLQQYGSVPFQFPKGVFASFNWESAQDSGEVQGNRIQSLGVTDGYGLGSGDFELLHSEARDWHKTMTSNGLYAVQSVMFNYRIIMSVNNGQDVSVIEVNGMKVKQITPGGMAKGSDAITLKYTYRANQIIVDGIPLFGDPSF